MRAWVRRCVALLFVCFVNAFDNVAENWPWWRHEQEPRLQQVVATRPAQLHCAGRLRHVPAIWDYKPCGGDKPTNCQEVINAEQEGETGGWRRLAQNSSTFLLPDVTPGDSGLYRCREAATDRIDVYSTTQLEVLEYTAEEDTRLPEFLNGLPNNLTVTAAGQVIMQCKVSSRTRPTIVWLAEGEGPITYKEKSYSLLNSSGEMALPGGVFLSKMVISHARLSDTGWYYCLAINTKGFSNHSAHLTVLPSAAQKGYSHFCWLFLIPVALAAIPLILWTIYSCNRSKSVVKDAEVRVQMVRLRGGTFKESEII